MVALVSQHLFLVHLSLMQAAVVVLIKEAAEVEVAVRVPPIVVPLTEHQAQQIQAAVAAALIGLPQMLELQATAAQASSSFGI